MSGARGSAYLSQREAAELRRLSAENNLTPSSVLRTGLRLLAGLPVPHEGQPLLEHARSTLLQGRP